MSVKREVLELAKVITDQIRKNPENLYRSGILRLETPPSVAIHCTLNHKQYLIIIQPTDLPDRPIT